MMAPMIYTLGTLSVLNPASSRAWRAACRMYTYAVPCCFKAPVRKEGQRIVTRFQLQDDIEEEICSSDPWIILHKIDSPTKMRYIGSKVASCNQTLDSTAVAPSIAAWVKQKGEHLASPRKPVSAGLKVAMLCSIGPTISIRHLPQGIWMLSARQN